MTTQNAGLAGFSLSNACCHGIELRVKPVKAATKLGPLLQGLDGSKEIRNLAVQCSEGGRGGGGGVTLRLESLRFSSLNVS